MNGDTEDLQNSLGRLTGQNWSKAAELNAIASTGDDPDDD